MTSKSTNAQQPFLAIANFVVSSLSRFARFFIFNGKLKVMQLKFTSLISGFILCIGNIVSAQQNDSTLIVQLLKDDYVYRNYGYLSAPAQCN